MSRVKEGRVTVREVMIDAYAIAFNFVVDHLVVQLAVMNIMYTMLSVLMTGYESDHKLNCGCVHVGSC